MPNNQQAETISSGLRTEASQPDSAEQISKNMALGALAGKVSAVIGIGLLVVLPISLLLALTAGGSGHPPGGVLILAYVAACVVFCSPLGLVLGLIGTKIKPTNSAKWGVLTNAVLVVIMITLFILSGGLSRIGT